MNATISALTSEDRAELLRQKLRAPVEDDSLVRLSGPPGAQPFGLEPVEPVAARSGVGERNHEPRLPET